MRIRYSSREPSGQTCSFSHTEKDIKIELIHNYFFDMDFFLFKYKTISCPFNLLFHDKGLCVYSHNWQDFRRNPDIYHYKPEQCPNWQTNKMIYEYHVGCPNSLQCDKCHGWKELEFHPLFYKTKRCTQENCNVDLSCPYFHNRKEQRSKKGLFNQFGDQVWVYTAKNRRVSGTFKNRKRSRSKLASNENSSFNISNENSRDNKGNEGLRNPHSFHDDVKNVHLSSKPPVQNSGCSGNHRAHDQKQNDQFYGYYNNKDDSSNSKGGYYSKNQAKKIIGNHQYTKQEKSYIINIPYNEDPVSNITHVDTTISRSKRKKDTDTKQES